MEWVPQTAWLSELRINSSVADLHYDLAVDVSGRASPSYTAAGLEPPAVPVGSPAAAGGLLALWAPLVLFISRRAA
jgi:hypothetical protein